MSCTLPRIVLLCASLVSVPVAASEPSSTSRLASEWQSARGVIKSARIKCRETHRKAAPPVKLGAEKVRQLARELQWDVVPADFEKLARTFDPSLRKGQPVWSENVVLFNESSVRSDSTYQGLTITQINHAGELILGRDRSQIDLYDSATTRMRLPELADYIPIPGDRFARGANLQISGDHAILIGGTTTVTVTLSSGFVTEIQRGDFNSGKSSYALYRRPLVVDPHLSVPRGIFEAEFQDDHLSRFRVVSIEEFVANPDIAWNDFRLPINRNVVVIDHRKNEP